MQRAGYRPCLGRRSVDVLVVGAGVSGVAVATGLAARGLETVLLERASLPLTALRGEFLQPRAVELARELGLGPVLEHAGATPVSEIGFQDLEHGGVASEFSAPFPGLAARALPQARLQLELWSHARTVLGADFVQGAASVGVDGRGASVRCANGESRRIDARWIVGCDGRNSSVRRWLQATPSRPPRRTARGAGLEFLVGADVPARPRRPERYSVVRTHGRGTLLAFPVGPERQRIYWSTGSATQLRRRAGRERQFEEALDSARSALDLDAAPRTFAAAPAETAWFGAPGRDRVVLVGDASSITSALGGQGITLALEHARWLLEEFAWNEQRPARIARCQHAYAAFVRRAFTRVGIINDFIYHLFFSRRPRLKRVTAHVMGAWNSQPEVAELVVRRFAGLDRTKTGFHDALRIGGILGAAPGFRWLLELGR